MCNILVKMVLQRRLFKYKRFKGGGCAFKILGGATLIRTLSIAPSVFDKSSFEFALTAE